MNCKQTLHFTVLSFHRLITVNLRKGKQAPAICKDSPATNFLTVHLGFDALISHL